MRTSKWLVLAVLAVGTVSMAGEPPQKVHFQGVLRDASDYPIHGQRDMSFSYYDSMSLGVLLLEEVHTGVAIDGGMFDVTLGNGTLTGHVYGSLGDLFAEETEVYLQLQIAGDADPLAPRIPIDSAPYCLNADRLEGHHAAEFVDTSPTPNTKTGAFVVQQTQGESVVTLGLDTTGVSSTGQERGGLFVGSTRGVEASGETGIWATGSSYAGYFDGTLHADRLELVDPLSLGPGSRFTFYEENDEGEFEYTESASATLALESSPWPVAGFFEYDTSSPAHPTLMTTSQATLATFDKAAGFSLSDNDSMQNVSVDLAVGGELFPWFGVDVTSPQTGVRVSAGETAGLFQLSDATCESSLCVNSGRSCSSNADCQVYAKLAEGTYGIRAKGQDYAGYFDGKVHVGELELVDPVTLAPGSSLAVEVEYSGGLRLDPQRTDTICTQEQHWIESPIFVAGSVENVAYGVGSTIGGGGAAEDWSCLPAWNSIGSDGSPAHFATVSGGMSNHAGGDFCTVAGGQDNQATGLWATVGGGEFNRATASHATVPGGSNNVAAGAHSFAAGSSAKANHPGTFVWGDNNYEDFASTAADQFLIRAGGGVGIGTAQPSSLGLEIKQKRTSSPEPYHGQLVVTGDDDHAYLQVRSTNPGAKETGIQLVGGGSLRYPEWTIKVPAGATQLRFNNVGADRMTLTPDGKLGIGTTNPAQTLSVEGSGSFLNDVTLRSTLYMNKTLHMEEFAGTDGYQSIFFYENGYYRGEQIAWNDSSDEFYISDALRVEDGIVKTGPITSVQNHPRQADLSVGYAGLEGDEVGTYTRGAGRLVAGEARIRLGESFGWVTNPDFGLTAQLTPRGTWSDLYVESLSTEELVVRSASGENDVVFDYVVMGLRIGFEDQPIVQLRTTEAPVPSAAHFARRHAEQPGLRTYTAASRFLDIEREVRAREEIDLSRTTALRQAIGEHDPDLDKLDPEAQQLARTLVPGRTQAGADGAESAEARSAAGPPDSRVSAAGQSQLPVDEQGNVYGRSFRPSAGDFATLVEVVAGVESGDVLVIDAVQPGALRLSHSAADSAVFGIVASEPGVVLGAKPLWNRETEAIDADQAEPIEFGTPRARTVKAPVAVSGVVLCKVDAGYGAIRPGDLLTTSPTPGHAMLAADPRPGTILGKALESVDGGTTTIKVLVMLR